MERRGAARAMPVPSDGGERVAAVGRPREAEALRAGLEGSLGVAFTDDNAVELFEDEEILERLAADLKAARRSITFQVYYVEKGRVLDRFAAIFRERAASGVRVLVLLDALGTKRLSLRAARRLFGPRVHVQMLRSWRSRHPLRFLRRAHCRSCIVDGRVAFTGGFGLADKWAPFPGEGPAWRELGLRVRGSAALRIQAHFMSLWAEGRGEVLEGPDLFPPEALDGGGATTAGALISSPSQPVSSAARFLEVLATSASRRLWIYSGYFAPGPEQRRLLERAARRGVDVRILTANERTDLPLVRLAGRGAYRTLLEAGVRIWEFQPRMLHAKGYLLDDHLVGVGSVNVEPVSTKHGDETAVIALDAVLAGSLAASFARDLERATEIRIEVIEREPRWRRLIASACASFTRLA